MAAGQDVAWQAGELHAFKDVVVDHRLLALLRDGLFLLRVPDDNVGIGAFDDRTLPRIHVKLLLAMLVDVTATNSFMVRRPVLHAVGPEHRHAVFKAAGAIGDFGEITDAKAFLFLARMVSGHHLQRAGLQACPK